MPGMNTSPLDAEQGRIQYARNQLRTWLVVGAIIVLLTVSAWAFAGPSGILWAAIGAALSVVLAGTVTPEMVARMQRARPLPTTMAPDLHRSVALLAERAGLEKAPALYYSPSRMPNAFAVGDRTGAIIFLTDGIFRELDRRELVGVIAHELAHIQAGDLGVLRLADTVRRVLLALAFLGFFIVLFNLPGAMALASDDAAFGLFLIMAAPTGAALLQLALSRTREHQADLVAVALTGDPDALGSALVKLDRSQRRWLAARAPGVDPNAEPPSLLRSHPLTRERLERLEALKRPGGAWGPWGPMSDPGYAPRHRPRSLVPETGHRR